MTPQLLAACAVGAVLIAALVAAEAWEAVALWRECGNDWRRP